MNGSRWQEIAPSQFAWEREAIAFLRARLPDHEPYRAWSNFEFIADDGTINEVDSLVLTPSGLFLIEIKSRPGEVSGDTHTWTWRHDGQIHTMDNPVFAANRKAKKLASLLRRQKSMGRVRLPFVEAFVFCSAAGIRLRLPDSVLLHVFGPDSGDPPKGGIVEAVTRRRFPDHGSSVDAAIARAVGRALGEAGIRPANRARRIGDYVLERILFEHPSGTCQDWMAKHASLEKTHRMVRLYPVSPSTPTEQRRAAEHAARREFELLQPLEHEGILQVETFTMHESGPALVFRLGRSAVRLDHFLREHGARTDFYTRLNLLRQIAEAVAFAHGRKVVHCRLCPQSVFVLDPEAASPRVKISNWQLGRRIHGASGSTGSVMSATLNAEQFAEDAAAAYFAPEVHSDPDKDGEAQDIFGIGALAYFLFSGVPPAGSSLETTQKVLAQQGLNLASVVDGASPVLCELVQNCTFPAVQDRYSRVREVLGQITAVEDEITRPEGTTQLVLPHEAKQGDFLAPDIQFKHRIASGSTAAAMRVVWAGRDVVLKVASKADHSDRVRAEFEIMKGLRHPRIVEAFEPRTFGPFGGFLVADAGEKTLAQHLRDEGPLALDYLERFGRDLLEAVLYLEEEKGVPHRDLKPDNMGIRRASDGRDHIALFDFSLSSASPENIRCGTTAYLDPFLTDRKPPRWDVAAERYAAALTLYEMATGELPKWGDGESHPAALSCEITLEPERFDAGIRDGLEVFFQRALRRDFKRRFDNAREMLEQWQRVFQAADTKTAGTAHPAAEDQDKLIAEAVRDTALVFLGITNRAANALDRAGLVTVEDFLRFPVFRLNRLRGIGKTTVRELKALHARLRPRFPDIRATTRSRTTDAGETITPTDSVGPDVSTLDRLAEQLLAGGAKGEGRVGRELLQSMLGIPTERITDPGFWPSQTDIARRAGVSRQRIGQALTGGRNRWQRNRSLTSLRRDVVDLIQAQGGVMAAQELVQALLAARGSELDEPERSMIAGAVARAAVEVELALEEPRLVESRSRGRVSLAQSYALTDFAFSLGDEADKLSRLDPLATPQRALEHLRAVKPPAEAPALSDARLLRLAVAHAEEAALSSRLEIYPKGMDPRRALQLAQGVLFAAGTLTPAELERQVRTRYPDTARFPSREELDRLLSELGSRLEWDPTADDGRGAYRSPTVSPIDGSTGSGTFRARTTRPATQADLESPDLVAARAFDERLQSAFDEGTFLVLMVPLRSAAAAEKVLRRRFPLVHRDCDALLIDALRREADSVRAKWDTVLRADGSSPGSGDWIRLQKLIERATARVLGEFDAQRGTVLLTNPGLLARYDRMDVLNRFRDEIGRTGSPLHGFWVLVPCDDQHSLPTLHGRPIPVLSAAQWARIPEAWLKRPLEGAAA